MEQRKLNLDLAESISQLKYTLKDFEVKTKKYNIFFRGKSFDFDGYRPYTSEDDVTFIDWRASARSNRPLVKQYKEEQNIKVLFIIDVSENMVLGSGKKLKCECAAEIVLSLSYILASAGNKVGYILYSDKVKEYTVPSRGLNNFYVFSDVLSNSATYVGGSKLDSAIDFFLDNSDASISAVVLVSDFISFNKNTQHYINLLANKYETFAFMIKDPLDLTLPDMKGEFVLEDPTSGQQILVEPQVAKRNYERQALKQDKFVKEAFKLSAIDLLPLLTTEEWVPKVTNFVKGRVENRAV